MAEVRNETEAKNPVHKAVVLLLKHLAIHQPEAAKESAKLRAEIDDHFSPDNEWKAPEPGLQAHEVAAIVDAKIEGFAATVAGSAKGGSE